MGKALVVVESPAKARTIQKYLGSGYQVLASMGHVRDLPQRELGVDIDQDFAPKYVVTRGRGGILKKLRAAGRTAQAVYLATDLDREGEAIAWHVLEALGLDPDRTYRVVFNEITAGAIRAAFAAPGKLDMNKVNAQQARRILDRLVGYKLSPLLWRKIRRGLSAGRVQSVAVRLVVEREREIEAFQPEEYWRIRAKLLPATAAQDAAPFLADLVTYDDKKFRPPRGDEAQAVARDLRAAAYAVADRQTKRRLDHPPPPFITSELQQAASVQLNFGGQRTMVIAQQLYEGVELGPRGPVALITYMRTDSHHVAQSAIQAVRGFIGERFGPAYVPEKPNYYASRASAQQAHEAIRPTDVAVTPEEARPFLDDGQFKLYNLIWKRFVASQMKSAEWLVTTLLVAAGQGLFRAIGRILVYDGHTKVTGLRLAENEQMLPQVEAGEALRLLDLLVSQHFTQPPPRYSEASLIKKLESLGIGRPSTYAAILSTIEERGYVEQTARRYQATELGKVVTDKLVEHFPDILNVDFTRHMEDDLDKIETGEMDYVAVLREFYEPFDRDLEAALKSMKRPEPKDTGRQCPKCGGKLLERLGRYGPFVGCEKYPDCKFIEKQKRAAPTGEATDLPCPACARPPAHDAGRASGSAPGKPSTGAARLVKIKSRRGTLYFACSDHEHCGLMFPADEAGHPKVLPNCTECDKPMVLRMSRGEPFLGCSGYPECRSTVSLGASRGKRGGHGHRRTARKMLPTDIACEKCGKMMVVRSGRRGPFLACPGYPRCKNAKDAPPELVDKFNALLAEAEPGTGPDGQASAQTAPADQAGASATKTAAAQAHNRKPPSLESHDSR